ncbi:MAG TPA: hypothetical protein VH502_11770, partial [Actinoplanes sp.]
VALVPEAAGASATATLCVGPAAGCSATLSTALAHAHDGDTVRVGPGRYAGGVTIDKSIRLVGAGARRTVIRGGGPVITIGRAKDPTGLRVSVIGMTVSGGVATGNGFESRGGGIDIAPSPKFGLGATVTVRDVVVAGNEATATRTADSPSGVKCPKGFCPYARARGGGIANSGRLTVIDSQVRGNRVDGPLSDANGGGIFSQFGSLRVIFSVVSGNRAAPTGIGRFAEGGAIFVDSGALTVHGTRVAGNHAELITSWPINGQGTLIDMNANSGGVHIGDGTNAVVTDTVITGNVAAAVDPVGEPLAFDGALCVCGDSTLRMNNTSVDHNRVYAQPATVEDVGASGSTLELDGPGTITNSRITDNTAVVHTADRQSAATNALAVYDFFDNPRQVTVSDTVIRGNRAVATSDRGTAVAYGAGVLNNSLLTMRRVVIDGNHARAASPTSPTAQGGGIWNGPYLSGPPVRLALEHSTVTGNSVSAGPGVATQGGGVYTTVAITRQHTTIVGNHPDNCFGC